MKKYLFAICLSMLLVIVGCGPGEEGGVISEGTPFLGGTSGVSINFENSPPAEVFDGGDFPFDVVVKLKNDGEWDVPADEIQVRVTGIRAEQFDLAEADLTKNAPEDLLGKNRDPTGKIIDSPPVLVEFNNFNHKEAITGAELIFPIRADVCYNYGTQAVTQLCIRENILSPKAGGICEVNEAKKVFNSGGPVQITEFSESARASDKVGFSFKVRHQGAGNIYEPASVCSKETRAFEDRVSVKVEAGVPGLACSGLGDAGATEGTIKLFGGEKVVTCTLTLASAGDYKLPLTITLGYDYESSTSTQILVKHTGE